jgi:hypothetical protein
MGRSQRRGAPIMAAVLSLLSGAASAQPAGQAPAATPPAAEPSAPGSAATHPERDRAARATGAEAEQEAPRELPSADIVRANLEPSYIVYPIALSGLDPLFFEANIAPNFVVTLPSWPFAVVLTPKILLRMFREPSEPVKTPSYMPRITAYFWFSPTVGGDPELYTSLTLSHHSNGQSGPFLNPDGTNNHEDGDFSTNFIEASLYATGHTRRYFGWSALSFEWHPDLNQNAELRGRYGLVRLHLASSVVSGLPWHGAVSARLSAILDGLERASDNEVVRVLERFPLSVRYAFAIPHVELGFYVAYYFGHDYYNIWFDRLLNVFQIGLFGGVSPSLLQTD